MKKITLYIGILILVLSACENPQNPIPYQYVDITIDLNKPEFIDLKAIGNAIEITGGVNGIIIYRSGLNEFKAYERTCPYDPGCGRIILNTYGDKMIHECCGSEFSLTMDGIVTKAPAELPLVNYNTIYYQNNNSLRITN